MHLFSIGQEGLLHARPKWFARPAQMVCASSQNGLRIKPKWFAHLAKWFAPHFENNGRPWENDLRVGLRLVCALICAWFALEGQRCL